MATLAERLKKSALNIEPEVQKEVLITNEKKAEPVKVEISKEEVDSLEKRLNDKDQELELLELKKQLEIEKKKYKELESKKIIRKSFKTYKAKTFRVTNEQNDLLKRLWNNLPKDVDRFENITSNSFLRALLQNLLEREDKIDLMGISTEEDVYTEIAKLFK